MGPLGIAVAGNVAGGLLGIAGGERANASNAKQAQLNRDFQLEMSSTAYQRAVADMKAAGLNPALAYQQGGASTPTGATAQYQNTMAGIGGNAATAAQTYNTTRLAAEQQKHIRAETEATRAQEESTREQTEQLRLERIDRLLELKSRIQLAGSHADQIRQTTPGMVQDLLSRIGLTETQRVHMLELIKNEAFLRPLRGRQITAETAHQSASARDVLNAAILKGLDIPRAQNVRNVQDSWYMKRVSPYLNDALKVTTLLNR